MVQTDKIAPLETVEVYRLYNPMTSEHLWTTSANEYAKLGAGDWSQEGTAWYSPESGRSVYRLYNPVLHTHHYTANQDEIALLVSEEGWVYDNDDEQGSHRALFCSAQEETGGKWVALESASPVYRLYNDALSQHHLTASAREYAALPNLGWTQESVAFYAYAA